MSGAVASPGDAAVCVVVGCALEEAVVYGDVVVQGLQQPTVLPYSDCFDSVLTVRSRPKPHLT